MGFVLEASDGPSTVVVADHTGEGGHRTGSGVADRSYMREHVQWFAGDGDDHGSSPGRSGSGTTGTSSPGAPVRPGGMTAKPIAPARPRSIAEPAWGTAWSIPWASRLTSARWVSAPRPRTGVASRARGSVAS